MSYGFPLSNNEIKRSAGFMIKFKNTDEEIRQELDYIKRVMSKREVYDLQSYIYRQFRGKYGHRENDTTEKEVTISSPIKEQDEVASKRNETIAQAELKSELEDIKSFFVGNPKGYTYK